MQIKLINKRPVENLYARAKYELDIINDVIDTYNTTVSSALISDYMVYKLWGVLAAASNVSKKENFSTENAELITKIISEFELVCKQRGLKW